MKKILSLLCALMLLVTMPGTVARADDSGSEAPLPEDDMFQLGDTSEYGEAPIVSAETDTDVSPAPVQDGIVYARLPSSYDLRALGVVPAVRNQGSFSTCWAMAATAAAEVSGLYTGLLGTDADDTDLSEWHLIYFMTHQVSDPLGNSSGDYNTNMSFWVSGGGNPIMATMTMASWHGMASEAATGSAYSSMSTTVSLSDVYAYADELHLENTYALDISTETGRDTLKQLMLSGGGAVLCLYYSSDYLFAGSPTLAAQPEAPEPTEAPEQTETPEPTESPEPTEAPEETEAPEAPAESDDPQAPDIAQTTDTADTSEDTDAAEITEPEPVPAAGLDGAAQEDSDSEDTESEDAEPEDYTVCYYQSDIADKTNHEVLIVGWDDDYPAENFGYSAAGEVPPGNGAWLCRNSYGAGWKSDGYFWVSYYDASVSYASQGKLDKARAVVFQFAAADDYENLYEYDGAAIMAYVNDTIDGRGVSTGSAGTNSRRWYGNVFTASASDSGTELLQAVSTYTYRPSVPYVLTIYLSPEDDQDPTSGTLVYTQEGVFDYAGLHTIALDQDIILQPGQRYAVIFQVAMSPDKTIFVPACYTNASWRAVNDSAAGQSFVSLDGESWYDCYDLEKKANVRVKAYTVAGPDLPFQDVAEDDWYYEAVQQAYDNHLIRGIDTTTFAPEATATRAQAVTVLHRLAGQPLAEFGTSFTDAAKQWYYEAVSWAQEAGLVQGSDDDGDGCYSFRPNDAITRQELVVLLYRWAQAQGLDVSQSAALSAFPDAAQVSDWALDAVSWSVAVGLQQGVAQADGTVLLQPDAPVTRAQLAEMLLRLGEL